MEETQIDYVDKISNIIFAFKCSKRFSIQIDSDRFFVKQKVCSTFLRNRTQVQIETPIYSNYKKVLFKA